MKFGKRLLAAVLVSVLALTMLTACGNAPGNVDLSKAKEILNPINARRTTAGMQSLTLSEEASLLLGNYAKAAAAYHANSTTGAKAALNAAIENAKTEVRKIKINGKPVCVKYNYTFYGSSSADDMKKALERETDWFVQEKDKACNYVAIATYGSGKGSAVVVVTLTV